MNSIKLVDILNHIKDYEIQGNSNVTVKELTQLIPNELTKNSLFWCSDKNQKLLLSVNKGIGIISRLAYSFLKDTDVLNKNEAVWVIVEKPRYVFMEIISTFFTEKQSYGIISKTASIDNDVNYNSKTINIGNNVTIEANCSLGDNVIIGHNTVIKKGTQIGNNVSIGNNNTIGSVGFGYELTPEGYKLIPHIGGVIINDKVEIGNNVCIDCAVMGNTIIGKNVKIDNLVHIAHGVKIGKNTLVIANSMIAGSVEVGENVWISPSVSIMQKTAIEDNSLIGMGSVVLKNVKENTVVAGVPSKEIKKK